MTNLSPAQYDFLTRGIDPQRVQHLRGQSHLEAWDIRRHLIRVFGFDGFDIETKSLDLVREIERQSGTDDKGTPKYRYTVVYRAQIRLSIKVGGKVIAVFEDGATGDSSNQPSLGDAHDQAMKTALSQGLKRCAVNLGDQFGLSLYNDGRADAVVVRSLISPQAPAETAAAVPEIGQDDAPVLPEPGTQVDEPEQAPEQAPAAVKMADPVDEPAATGDAVGMMTDLQRGRMFALFSELGQKDRKVQLQFINWAIHQQAPNNEDVTSRAEMTHWEADVVIRALADRKASRARQAVAA